MNKIAVLDTNLIYALFDKTDTNHQKSVDMNLKIDTYQQVIIPLIVFAELNVSLKYRSTLTMVHILKGQIENHLHSDLIFVEDIPKQRRNSLKSNDLLILGMTLRMNGDLFSLDKKLMSTFKRSKKS